MAKKRMSKKTKTVYRTAPRSKRKRYNKLNASTKKRLAGLGMAGGIATVMVPVAINAISTKSIDPVSSAFTNVDTYKNLAIRGGAGYAIGYGTGIIADKTGLKKPINKALKFIKVI